MLNFTLMLPTFLLHDLQVLGSLPDAPQNATVFCRQPELLSAKMCQATPAHQP